MKGLSKLNAVLGSVFTVGSIISLVSGIRDTHELASSLMSLVLGLWLIILGYLLLYKKKCAYHLTIWTYTLFTLYFLVSVVHSILMEGFQYELFIYGIAILTFLFIVISNIKDNKSDFI